jgi:hypothetical protein
MSIVTVVALWALAGAFFAAVGFQTARGLTRPTAPGSPGTANGAIVDLAGALVALGIALAAIRLLARALVAALSDAPGSGAGV